MRAGVGFVFLMLSTGCPEGFDEVVPTPSGYRANVASYEGRDVATLVASLGAPTRTVEMPPDRVVYVWEDLSELRTDVVARSEVDARTGEHSVRLDGGDRVPFDCLTEATVDSTGRITATRTQGIGCWGLAPSSPESSPPAAARANPPRARQPATAGTAPPVPQNGRVQDGGRTPDEPAMREADTQPNTQMQRPSPEPSRQRRRRRRGK